MERCKNFGLKFAFGIAVCLWPDLAADSAAGCCSLTAMEASFHSHLAMSINVNKTITVTCSWAKGKDMSGVGEDENGIKRMNSQRRLWTWCHVRVAGKRSWELHDQRAGDIRDRKWESPCSCHSWSFEIEAGWPLNRSSPTKWFDKH